jgi:hypothetical protein
MLIQGLDPTSEDGKRALSKLYVDLQGVHVCVLILLYVSSPHTTIHVSAYYVAWRYKTSSIRSSNAAFSAPKKPYADVC